MVSRILSGIIAVGYLVFAISDGGAEAVFPVMMYVGFCVACIWFSEAMGDFVGGRVTDTTPDWAVAFMGWLLLLLPIFVCFYLHGK